MAIFVRHEVIYSFTEGDADTERFSIERFVAWVWILQFYSLTDFPPGSESCVFTGLQSLIKLKKNFHSSQAPLVYEISELKDN